MTRESILKYRIGELEKDVVAMKSTLDKVMTNHLPHLQESITKLTTRVNAYFIIQIGGVLAVILTLLSIVRQIK